MKIIYILLFFTFSSLNGFSHFSEEGHSHGRSTKSAMFIRLPSFFLYYHEAHNTNPETWEQFDSYIQSKFSFAHEEVKEHLNYQEEYQLFSPPLKITTYPGEHLVLAMGINGQVRKVDTEDVDSRLLIVKDPKGKIKSMGMNEDKLAKVFSDSGLDLADYTKELPPSKEEEEKLQSSDQEQNGSPSLFKNGSDQEEKKIEAQEKEQPEKKNGLLWIVGVLVLAALWIVARAKLKKA